MGTSFTISARRASALRRTVIPLLVALGLMASQLPVVGVLAADAAIGPWSIDGTVPDSTASMQTFSDPCNAATDDKPINGDAYKLNSIQDAGTPVFENKKLGTSKSDLCNVWLDLATSGDDVLLYFAWQRYAAQGAVNVSLELQKGSLTPACQGSPDFFSAGGCNPFANRQAGDLLLTFDFDPVPAIYVRTWTGSDWSSADVLEAHEAEAAIDGDKNSTLRGESAINLTEAGILPSVGTECVTFATVLPFSQTGNSTTAELQDVVLNGFPGPSITNCGGLQLAKTDTNGAPLEGATLELYEDEAPVGSHGPEDVLVGSCVTGTDSCLFTDLFAGSYVAVETVPPPGHKLSDPSEQFVDVVAGVDSTVTFQNPPIRYAIDVDPEDVTNAVGYSHTFEVTLTTDYLFGDPARESDEIDIPLAGQTVDLSWASGPDDSGILRVTDANGTGADQDPLAGATTCVTTDDGTCTVEVLSNSVGGPGTLTASYDTAEDGGTVGVISDSGDKSWIGYRAELDGDADNPLGEDHTFTATVYEVAADGTESPTDDEVTVTFGWDGPAGSDLQSTTCTTAAGGDGTCTVTVDSPTVPGTGTINIASVAGEIVAGEDLVIEYEDDEVTADKTWWDYRVSIDGDSTNPVGDEHTFTVTVERNDGSGWGTVPDGTTLELDWDSDVDSSISDDGCSSGGTTGGTCEVTVTTTEKGAGTLTVTGIAGTTLGDHLGGQEFSFDTDDASATKLWIDWEASISAPAQNPVGEEHTFTITAQVWDGDEYVDVPDGTIVGLDLDASDLGAVTVVENTCEDPGTVDGTCTLTVSADEAIVLTVEVGSIDETVIDDGGADRTVDFTFDDPAGSSKEWIEYRIVGDDDASNLVGDDHTFTLTAQQRQEGGDWVPVEGVTLDVDLEAGGVGTITDGTCTTSGTAADGTCTVVVSSGVPGQTTVVATGIDGIELLDGGTATSTTAWDVEVDATSQVKTWVRYDVDLSGDAVNNVGDDHDFTVDVTVDDGSGPQPAAGATVTGVFEQTSPAGGSTDVECTTDVTGSCTITIPAPEDGDGPIAAVGELTLTGIEHDYSGDGPQTSFDVDLTGTLGLPAEFEQPSSVKQWIDYTLNVTPPTATNLLPVEPDHTFTVSLGSSDAATAPIAGRTIDLELDSTVGRITEIVDGNGTTTYHADDVPPTSCTTTATGTCEVTVTTDGPGTADLTASFATSIGEASFALSDTGEKLWTTYRVRVTPDQAQNLLGTPHTFTVYVEQNDGGDWIPVAGATPELSVTEPAFIVDGTDTCADGTDADGACTVQIDSPITGAFTLTAVHEGVVGQQSALFDASGGKQWIDYLVTVTPETAENLVGTDHVFTVLVQVDSGDGFVPVPGAVPTLDLAGPGAITETTCDEGTLADGTCTVSISSATPGLSTLTATYLGTAGVGDGGTLEEAEFADVADKLWVDYLLEVDPDEAINALDDPHTFTVSLTRDQGQGPAAAPGQSVDLTLTGPGTITAIETGTVDEDGRGGTCTTSVSGTCEVTIVSSESGTAVLGASYLAEVGETSATFTDSGTKQWAAITLEKTALVEAGDDGLKVVTFDPAADEPLVIDYEYLITNTGPVALTVTSLEDDVLGSVTLPEPLVLEPGESATATASHTVTEADADAGEIVNVAVVTGEAADGTEVTASDDEEVLVQVVLAGAPAIGLIKTALVDTDGNGNRTVEVREGETETVTYRYRITNLGDVELSDLSLVDDKIGGIDLPATSLAPGESITVDADYTLTAADIDAGEVENVAVATGVDPTGTEVDATDDEVVDIVEVLVVVEEPEEPTEVKPAVIRRTLPRTGSDGEQLLALGVLLAAIGAAALLFTPRRRRSA